MNLGKLIQILEGVDPNKLIIGASIVAIIAMLVIVGSILWFFISAIGYRKMFLKAGESGWKAFIPYYRKFINFKFAWNPRVFWPFLITALLVRFVPTESMLQKLVVFVSAIIYLVLNIKLDLRVAKSFGKTKGWGVLLFFFPFIVSLILGFGKAEYIGNTTIIKAEEDNT